jgi:hypothetical protein
MVEPRKIHWKVAKHLLRYLKGIIHYGVRYVGDGEFLLHGFINLDWVGDASTRKSAYGYCFSSGLSMISGSSGSK